MNIMTLMKIGVPALALALSGCGSDDGSEAEAIPPEVSEIREIADQLVAEIASLDGLVHGSGFPSTIDGEVHRIEAAVNAVADAGDDLEDLAVRTPLPADEVQVLLVDRLYIKGLRVSEIAGALRPEVDGADVDATAKSNAVASLDRVIGHAGRLGRMTSDYASDFQEAIVLDFGERQGPLNPSRLESGNTLVALTFADRVVELDSSGAVAWQFADVGYPTDAERLPSENTLIADRDGSRAIEVQPDGTVVWEYGGVAGLYGVQRLANGNTLLTVQGDYTAENPAVLLEVDSAGQTVWSYGGAEEPLLAPSAERLADGHTLIADNSGYADGTARVFEIDAAGEVVWEHTAGLYGLYGVHRLASGNTLINDQGNGRLIEVTPAGEIVWRFGALDTPGGFAVLPSGGMLIAEFAGNRLFEIEPR
jgi:hypothetical protein